ncbi:MAG: histidine--tRNA ligase [Gammaproteobacteria bacterium]|nr:histidine--tRNA ligase [Gammaproteobacteria bacterium]
MKMQAVRGMQDLLPAKKRIFRYIEDLAREVFVGYGYREVGLPLIEYTNLFERLVGETTDIVEKEMYTFEDKNGESITLRPEGTAVCARFADQNGLLFNQVQRFWYHGPMFRYERPQKGRYRQFEQIGAECFGIETPDIDAELILMSARLFKLMGIEEKLSLELNSLGNEKSRARFKSDLVRFLGRYKKEIDKDSQRRLTANPLRILDSKDPGTKKILSEAPRLMDYLDVDSRSHFEMLREILDDCGVSCSVNPQIVRGLDYYNRTVFEWTTESLGAQGTVCGGGRYDSLIEQLGGKATAGIGFAIGIDRLALMLEEKEIEEKKVDIYFVSPDIEIRNTVFIMAEKLKDGIPRLSITVHCGDGKLKSQMKKADVSGARLALILGEEEFREGVVGVKFLREMADQVSIPQGELVRYCLDYFGKEKVLD